VLNSIFHSSLGAVLTMFSQNASFQHCVFCNSSSTNGLVYSNPEQSSLTFTNCSFSKITASNEASSVLLQQTIGTFLTFRQCNFDQVSMNVPLFTVPALEKFARSVVFDSCIFTSSVQSTKPLIQALGDTFPNSYVSLNSCIFRNIYLSSPSGVVSILSSSDFLISNCSFHNISNPSLGLLSVSRVRNFIVRDSWFVYFEGLSLLISYSHNNHLITNSNFSKIETPLGFFLLRTVTNFSVSNSSFSSIHGSFFAENSDVSLNDCVFSDFPSKPIFKISNSSIVGRNLELSSSTNMQGNRGGGCLRLEVNAQVRFTNVSMRNCSSNWNGGAIFMGNSTLMECVDCAFEYNKAGLSGGALFSSVSSLLVLKNSSFKQNIGQVDGGAIFQDGCGFFENNSFIMNWAFRKGGALAASQNMSCLSIVSNNFDGNSAEKGGGAFFKEYVSDWRNNSFTRNKAINRTARSCSDSSGSGGGVFFEFLNFSLWTNITSWTVGENNASFFGGGIGIHNFSSPEGFNASVIFPQNDSNAAMYGSFIGTLWNSIQSSGTDGTPVFLGDTLIYSIQVFDGLNQTAHGVVCPASISVVTSDPVLVTNISFFEIEQGTNGFVDIFFCFMLPEAAWNLSISPSSFSVVQLIVSSPFRFQTSLTENVVLCGPGFQLEVESNFVKCVACSAGKFLNSTDPTYSYCQECLPGQFSSGESSSCDKCGVGLVSPSIGSESCNACSPGSFASRHGLSMCDLCYSHSFSSEGSSSCSQCPGTSITLNEGSSSQYFCVCPNGMYGKPWEGEEMQILQQK
jgi:hypothetical protein